jgi:hypothetical protein
VDIISLRRAIDGAELRCRGMTNANPAAPRVGDSGVHEAAGRPLTGSVILSGNGNHEARSGLSDRRWTWP